MRRTVLSLAAAGAALGLALAPAAAMAAPTIYIYTWEDGDLVQYTEPAAGIGEVVPTTAPTFEVTGLDVADSGAGFAVTFTDQSHLVSVDVLTGDVVDLGVLTFDGDAIGFCTGLDLTAGVLTVVCDFVPDQGGSSVYLTVDPVTLETSVVAVSDVRAASIAVDPADGQLYGFGYTGQIMAVSAGSAVEVGVVDTTLWGADFASDGSLWGTVGDPDVAGPTVGPWTFHAAAHDLEGGDFTENITVYEAAAPVAPQLAATGSDPAPVLFGAVAVMMLGAGLATAVAVRRRAA